MLRAIHDSSMPHHLQYKILGRTLTDKAGKRKKTRRAVAEVRFHDSQTFTWLDRLGPSCLSTWTPRFDACAVTSLSPLPLGETSIATSSFPGREALLNGTALQVRQLS